MANTYVLVCGRPSRPNQSYPLRSGTTLLGRSSECDLVVGHRTISRRHAKLSVIGDTVMLVDLDSSNGTFVGGRRVSQDIVAGCTLLHFGSVPFLLASKGLDDEELSSELDTENRDKTGESATKKDPWLGLTKAQRRVLDLLMDGMAEKQIAARLEISSHTVHNHVREIYKTFEVHSRSRLVAQLLQQFREALA